MFFSLASFGLSFGFQGRGHPDGSPGGSDAERHDYITVFRITLFLHQTRLETRTELDQNLSFHGLQKVEKVSNVEGHLKGRPFILHIHFLFRLTDLRGVGEESQLPGLYRKANDL